MGDVRAFVQGALDRLPSAEALAKSKEGRMHRLYAEGVVAGAGDTLRHVLEFLDQEEEREANR